MGSIDPTLPHGINAHLPSLDQLDKVAEAGTPGSGRLLTGT
jgi:hypothetical protein